MKLNVHLLGSRYGQNSWRVFNLSISATFWGGPLYTHGILRESPTEDWKSSQVERNIQSLSTLLTKRKENKKTRKRWLLIDDGNIFFAYLTSQR